MSDEKRNESQLISDILGLESLVDEITYKVAGEAPDAPTATAILGPFWRKDAPRYPMNSSIVQNDIRDVDHAYIFGQVTDYATGKPVKNTELDVWHTAPNGLYEQQDPDQPDFNLRGRFTTGEDGKYSFYCLRPTKYPIPVDGPAGVLLQALDRHPWRPAHIHFIVSHALMNRSSIYRVAYSSQISAPGYKPIITQIFDRRDEYITNDAVFAVKDSLVVDFKPRSGDARAQVELPYDFKLVSYEEANKRGLEGATEIATAEP